MAPEFDHVKLKALLRTGCRIAVLGGYLLGLPPIGIVPVGRRDRTPSPGSGQPVTKAAGYRLGFD
jgi:hypothetical protein